MPIGAGQGVPQNNVNNLQAEIKNEDNFTEVSLQVGNIGIDDNETGYVQDETVTYTDYTILNRFEKDRHIYMMGITSPGGLPGAAGPGSVAFVQLASPTLLWISEWTACSFGQPKIPDPASKDPNWILLDDHWEPHNPTFGPDGSTPLYRISGTYVYGHKNPSVNTVNNINYGRPPWMDSAVERKVLNNTLTQNLSNIVGAIGGGVAVPRPNT